MRCHAPSRCPASPSTASASRISPTRSTSATSVLRELEAADAEVDPSDAARHLGFVFVGAGYAGVEALAELSDLVKDALRWYPRLREVPQRWVLVDAAPKILPEIPPPLGEYAAKELGGRGVEIHVSTTLASFDGATAELSNGERIPTHTLVWTAGVKASPLLERFGIPLDERGRVQVDSFLRVEGRERIWSLGDCAAVPNERTPGPLRPADLPARAPPGAPAGEEHRAATRSRTGTGCSARWRRSGATRGSPT